MPVYFPIRYTLFLIGILCYWYVRLSSFIPYTLYYILLLFKYNLYVQVYLIPSLFGLAPTGPLTILNTLRKKKFICLIYFVPYTLYQTAISVHILGSYTLFIYYVLYTLFYMLRYAEPNNP